MGALVAFAQQVLFGLGLVSAGEQALGILGREGDPQPSFATAAGRVAGRVSAGLFGARGQLVKRHRRRKALTNDDVRLALTIASSISKKAAETFIAMRVRSR